MSRVSHPVRVLLRELATITAAEQTALEGQAQTFALRLAVALGDEDLAGELRELVRVRAMVRAGRAPALAQVQRGGGGAR